MSVTFDAIDKVTAARCYDRSDDELLRDRYRSAFIMVQGHDNRFLIVKTGSGYIPGDVNAPQSYAEAANSAFDRWRKYHATSNFPFCVEDFYTNNQFQVDVTVLADDTGRSGTARNPADLHKQLAISDKTFNACLNPIGLFENLSKRKVLVNRSGPFALDTFPGFAPAVKYLGAIFIANGSLEPDLRKIIASAHNAWYAMQGLWSSPLQQSEKVKYYKSLVQSILLSGAEACSFTFEQLHRLEAVQCKLLRKLMCGRA